MVGRRVGWEVQGRRQRPRLEGRRLEGGRRRKIPVRDACSLRDARPAHFNYVVRRTWGEGIHGSARPAPDGPAPPPSSGNSLVLPATSAGSATLFFASPLPDYLAPQEPN
eukprot:5259277-Prymnesium_polylepis.3